MVSFTGADRALVCFGSKKRNLLLKFKGNVALSIASGPTIYTWHKDFIGTERSVRHAMSPSRPFVSEATVEQLRESFVRSPRKSTRRASREICIPNVTVFPTDTRGL
jgi:hypothetical protein